MSANNFSLDVFSTQISDISAQQCVSLLHVSRIKSGGYRNRVGWSMTRAKDAETPHRIHNQIISHVAAHGLGQQWLTQKGRSRYM